MLMFLMAIIARITKPVPMVTQSEYDQLAAYALYLESIIDANLDVINLP
jgi:hypothetical protein